MTHAAALSWNKRLPAPVASHSKRSFTIMIATKLSLEEMNQCVRTSSYEYENVTSWKKLSANEDEESWTSVDARAYSKMAWMQKVHRLRSICRRIKYKIVHQRSDNSWKREKCGQALCDMSEYTTSQSQFIWQATNGLCWIYDGCAARQNICICAHNLNTIETVDRRSGIGKQWSGR